MGVKNLWRLLLPVGHRLSIETLAHQTLAIDASIWLTQISKACRDPETGRLLPNRPHVRIFLVRLMRLLFHRIRPVVVFDGAMPEAKRREIQRRKHRREKLWRDDDDGEGAGGALKRTAKKILVQQLKEWREKEARGLRQTKGGTRKQEAAAAEDEAAEDGPSSNDGAFAAGFTIPGGESDRDVGSHAPDAKGTCKEVSPGKHDSKEDVISIHSEEEDREGQRPTHPRTQPQREDDTSGESDNDWETSHAVQASLDDARRPRHPPPRPGSSSPAHPRGAHGDADDAAVAALPALARSRWIDAQHASQRIRARRECLRVAADPRAYSDTQLRNLLRGKEMKRRAEEIEREAAAAGARGEAAAGGGARGPGFRRLKRRGQGGSDSDGDGDVFAAADAAEGGRASMKTLFGEDDSDSDDDEGGGGFLVAPPAELNFAPTEVDKKEVVLLDDDTEDDGDNGVDEDDAQRNEGHNVAPASWNMSASAYSDVVKHARGPISTNALSSAHTSANNARTMFGPAALLALSTAEQEWEEWAGAAPDDEPPAVRSHDAVPPTPSRIHRDGDATAAAAPGEASESDSDGDGQGGSFLLLGQRRPALDRAVAPVPPPHAAQTAGTTADEAAERDHDSDDDDVDWEEGGGAGNDLPRDEMAGVPPRELGGGVPEDTRERHARAPAGSLTVASSISTENQHGLNPEHSASTGNGVIQVPSEDDDITAGGREAECNSVGREDARKEPPESSPTPGRHSFFEDSSDGHTDKGFDPFRSDNLNAAALQHAQETASRLTSWAGRAFQRAISAHVGEQQTRVGSPSDTQDLVAPEKELVTSTTGTNDCVDVDVDDNNNGAGDATDAKNVDQAKPSGTDLGPRGSPSPRTSPPPGETDPFDTSLEGLTHLHDALLSEEKAMERDMSTITDEMKEDILALLRLCGIPWVEAPSEAEAQCAALEELGLVDGVVTEDSDIFVFGGRKVYKNFFNEMKYVEAYFAKDIERELALKKHQLVALAMLLGGDYTDGVKGVGIVNGMEALQAFPIEDSADGVSHGLQQLREWLEGFDDPSGANGPGEDAPPPSEEADRANLVFRKKHSSARTRWIAPADFPSKAIINAYLKPVVDTSKARFSWGRPDLPGLRRFCAETVGWEREETDRAVNPVLKMMESGSTQTRLESYFMKYEDGIKFAAVRSTRLKAVLKDIQFSNAAEAEGGTAEKGGEDAEMMPASATAEGAKPKRKRQRKKK